MSCSSSAGVKKEKDIATCQWGAQVMSLFLQIQLSDQADPRRPGHRCSHGISTSLYSLLATSYI